MATQIELKEIDGSWFGVIVDSMESVEDVVVTIGYENKEIGAFYAAVASDEHKIPKHPWIQKVLNDSFKKC